MRLKLKLTCKSSELHGKIGTHTCSDVVPYSPLASAVRLEIVILCVSPRTGRQIELLLATHADKRGVIEFGKAASEPDAGWSVLAVSFVD